MARSGHCRTCGATIRPRAKDMSVAAASRIHYWKHHREVTDATTHLSFVHGWNLWQLWTLARELHGQPQPVVLCGDHTGAVSTTHELPHTSVSEVGRVLKSHHKVRGLVMARRAYALCSPRSASPLETRTRLLAHLDAGLVGLGVNVPVFDADERLLGVADLLDEESGLVIESDGGGHREQTQHTMDNRREEGFERAGLVVCRVTALDHRERWNTVGRIVAAHRDAATSTRRAWTTQKPDWWYSWKPGRRWD